KKAAALADKLTSMGYTVAPAPFFDTITITGSDVAKIKAVALEKECNFHFHGNGNISISLDETTGINELNLVLLVFAQAAGSTATQLTDSEWFEQEARLGELTRNSGYL